MPPIKGGFFDYFKILLYNNYEKNKGVKNFCYMKFLATLPLLAL